MIKIKLQLKHSAYNRIVLYWVSLVQDPVLACGCGVGVMRACDRLKSSLALRIFSKALFYYKHYVLSIYKLQCNVKGKGQLQVVFAPKSALRKCFYIWLSLTFKLIIENCLSFWKIKCRKLKLSKGENNKNRSPNLILLSEKIRGMPNHKIIFLEVISDLKSTPSWLTFLF